MLGTAECMWRNTALYLLANTLICNFIIVNTQMQWKQQELHLMNWYSYSLVKAQGSNNNFHNFSLLAEWIRLWNKYFRRRYTFYIHFPYYFHLTMQNWIKNKMRGWIQKFTDLRNIILAKNNVTWFGEVFNSTLIYHPKAKIIWRESENVSIHPRASYSDNENLQAEWLPLGPG